MRFKRALHNSERERLKSPFQHAANDGLRLQIAERYCSLYRLASLIFPQLERLLELI